MKSQPQMRSVVLSECSVSYALIRKPVKNLNLRIRPDGTIVVSANQRIAAQRVDDFVRQKGAFILSALAQLERARASSPPPMQYRSGEIVYLLGKAMQLQVRQGEEQGAFSDGTFLHLTVQDDSDFQQRERSLRQYLLDRCRTVFDEVARQTLPQFHQYHLPMPTIKIRDMKTRWGSCSPSKQSITLNARLIALPMECIEYVVLHEFCHFIHPDHSNRFYSLVQSFMPDWNARRELLKKAHLFGQ